MSKVYILYTRLYTESSMIYRRIADNYMVAIKFRSRTNNATGSCQGRSLKFLTLHDVDIIYRNPLRLSFITFHQRWWYLQFFKDDHVLLLSRSSRHRKPFADAPNHILTLPFVSWRIWMWYGTKKKWLNFISVHGKIQIKLSPCKILQQEKNYMELYWECPEKISRRGIFFHGFQFVSFYLFLIIYRVWIPLCGAFPSIKLAAKTHRAS